MNSSHANNGVELQDSNKTIRSNQVVCTQSDGKQTANTNANESKRIIKQIVSLDSKKLKALGIESNILSALTKFNGKERSLSKAKPLKNVHQPSKSTSSSSLSPTSLLVNRSQTESPVQQHISSNTATISSSQQCVSTAHDPSAVASSKSPETPPTKKIHVLSNVLLNEHKLSLKDFTAIASSTPVNNTNVSYVSQVPDHDKVTAPIDCESIVEIKADPHISNTTEKPIEIVSADDINDTTIENQANDEEINEIRIEVDEQKEKKTVRSLQKQSSEIDSLKGFSSIDLKMFTEYL